MCQFVLSGIMIYIFMFIIVFIIIIFKFWDIYSRVILHKFSKSIT